ncbi:phosphate transporter, partial [Thalassiosira pseudonana CCMP1335]
MIVGQLIGGFLGDVLGRRNAMLMVMMLQIGGSLGSALLIHETSNYEGFSALEQLALWRFLLGIGAGGVYPLAAYLNYANEVEDNSTIQSFQRIALTFSTQGLGFITVPLLAYPMLELRWDVDLIWRLLLGVGAIPGFIVLYLRMFWRRNHHKSTEISREGSNEGENNPLSSDVDESTINADQSMTKQHQRNQGGSLELAPSKADIDGRKFVGTAGTWFLFDVLFYGNTLFEPLVLEAAFGSHESNDDDGYGLLQTAVRDSLVISLLSLPGYFVSVLLIGRRISMQGFILMFALYLILGLFWGQLSNNQWLLLILYGGTFFFANYGPNTTTFLLPSVTYSEKCRSTLNGLSAACGKLGALCG